MMDTCSWIYLWIVTLGLHALCEAEFCFRKIHGPDDTQPGAIACRGLIDKQGFSSSRACCDSESGKAFARELTPVGKRNRKWRCIPCWTDFVQPVPIVNGTGWSAWSEWSACSVTCAVGTKVRQRLCQGSDPSSCEGDNKNISQCWETLNCPVDGNWGPWNLWSECTKSCANGTRVRTRQCNDPPPEHNGKDCEEEGVAVEECNIHGCPVDGGWSNWTSDEKCDVTCGKGKITRIRLCNQPEPKNGGKYCTGRDLETERCDTYIKCPIDGQWSLWSRYSPCSTTCGEGQRERTRACVAPSPRHHGRDCKGNATDIQTCYSHNPCPVDGNWTDWSEWGMCLARPCSNDTGVQTRTRTCSNPQPQFRGKQCSGTTTDTQTCQHNHNCPVHGKWCEWQPYSLCRQTDNNIKFRMRIRECDCPMPKHGGKTCIGDDYQVSNCLVEGNDVDNPRNTRCNYSTFWNRLEGSGYGEDDEDC